MPQIAAVDALNGSWELMLPAPLPVGGRGVPFLETLTGGPDSQGTQDHTMGVSTGHHKLFIVYFGPISGSRGGKLGGSEVGVTARVASWVPHGGGLSYG